MHVAISGWLLGPPSGANRRLLALIAHTAPLLEAGERITVLHRPGFAPPAITGVTWRATPITAGPTLRRVRSERRHLAAFLRELGADVLDHGFLPLPRVDLPACLLIHDLRGADGLSRWPRGLARRAVQRSCARAAAVVVPSRFTAERVRAVAPGCEPIVIANGTELPPAAAPPAPTTPGYLLHTGHLEARKNLPVVLRALAQLPANERPELVLAGRDAGRANALRRLAARLGITAQIRFAGVPADDELHLLLAGARAVVMPSTYEGFGLPALDGLACGRPVLVAAAGALPEVVGGAGVVLPPDDAAAWARAIAATARDESGAPARRRAHARSFPWSGAAARTLELWRRLAGRPVSARS